MVVEAEVKSKTRVGIEELLDFRRKGVSSVHAVRTCIPTNGCVADPCLWRVACVAHALGKLGWRRLKS